MKIKAKIHTRIKAFLTSFALLTTTAAAFPSAEKIEYETLELPSLCSANHHEQLEIGESELKVYGSPASPTIKSVADALYVGIVKMQKEIDIYAFNITPNQLLAAFEECVYSHPDIFYVGSSFNYSYKGSKLYTMSPKYLYTSDAVKTMLEEYYAEVDYIIENVLTGEMEPLEKAFALNEFFGSLATYDLSGVNNNAYHLLVDKYTQCQGYSLGIKEILDRVGVECYLVSSVEMNHAWNAVKVDDIFYHLDTTWNKGGTVTIGKSFNIFTLKSEKGMNEHYGYYTVFRPATDTTFDNWFWKDIRNSFTYDNGKWYFFDNKSGYVSHFTFGNSTVTKLFKPTTVHRISGEYFTSVVVRDGILYYNDSKNIYSYNLETESLKTIKTVTGTGSIYGIAEYKGWLGYTQKTSPDNVDNITYFLDLSLPPEPVISATETTVATTAKLTETTTTATTKATATTTKATTTTTTIPKVTGDVDGDYVVTIADLILIAKLVYGGKATGISALDADLNGDKRVDIFDLTLCKDILLFQ